MYDALVSVRLSVSLGGTMWRFILVSFAFLGWSFYVLSGGSDYMPRADSLQAYWDNNRTLRRAEAESETEARRTLAAAQPREVKPQPAETAEASGTSDQAAAIDQALLAALDAEKSGGLVRATGDAGTATTTLAELKDETAQPYRVEVTLATATDLGLGFSLAGLSADAAPLPGEEQVQTRIDAAEALATPEIAAEIPTEITTETPIDAAPADIRSVTGRLVNMRAGPGAYYEKVTQLRQGTRVEVIDRSSNGWLYLRVAETGTEGWMAGWLVTASN